MSLQDFHPYVRGWFLDRFKEPTAAQAQGWPAIARGRHTLIAAPTGSGKTLAAFMTSIDSLVREGLNGGLPDSTQVVYVSPLKALSNDIRRNLSEPLAGIGKMAEQVGQPLPEIRTSVRTGDTSQSERQAMVRRPPHILITTPESLYILLTSESGRKSLRHVRTLILDELHAVAGNKRGSHLSLSVERLCELAEEPVTRIGLSATQNPIEEVARFLVGSRAVAPDGKPDCTIVDSGHSRTMDLAIELPPDDELGPIATHEQWDRMLDRVSEMVARHDSTLLFVNTRRLVERVAHQMSLRLGQDAVVPHHGSLSQETRHKAEQLLKDGSVKLCVATSSLELGIDIGSVDLVCQIGSPRSIGLMLQRVGRSGHSVGGTPKGRLFPLTRDELMECLALIRGYRRGNLDTLSIPPWPLDVLAQQLVAECAGQPWDEDRLLELVRRAYPYRDLTTERFAEIVGMLSRGVAPREGRRSAYLHHDAVNGKLRARRGARLAALTSGGAIPDNADYDVILEPDNTFLGTVNEDFAIESMKGDVFLLGNTPWRIRRVESGKVRVEDAGGASPNIPFWIGEAPGRTTELSDEVSELRDGLYERLDGSQAIEWLIKETGASRNAAEQAAAYIEEGVRILGTVPTKRRIVAERFFDEAGGMQLIVHSPFGSRINRAWGMALRKEICRTFDFELQAAATEDGINLSLGPSLSFPLGDTFRFVPQSKVTKVLTQAVLQSPLFGVRWRWDASRALALLRFSGGKRVPPPLQRMRSDDLLAAVFPEQVACQDNAPPGDIELPDHPLVFETMRDCLTEAMDVDGLADILRAINGGEIEVLARDTTQPSVFSHQVLNAMPYAFLDDAPLEERRSRAVALRRALPEDSRDLGSLSPAAIAEAAKAAWPVVRDKHELHDALLTLGVLPEQDLGRGAGEPDPAKWSQWLDELAGDGRAARVEHSGGTAWAATEMLPLAAAAFPDLHRSRQGGNPSPAGTLSHSPSKGKGPGEGEDPPTQDEAELVLVRSRTESIGPFTPDQIAAALGMKRGAVDIALAHLEATGNILRGRFTPGEREEEFCDRRILARIHRATISGLRREIEPISASAFIRFLARWQHAVSPARLDRGNLLEVIEQLQGFEAAAGAWEADILPLRIPGYTPGSLDDLCLGGEVVWGRFSRRTSIGDSGPGKATMSRNVPISFGLREALGWLLNDPPEDRSQVGAAAEIMDFLDQRGASFVTDITSALRRLPSDVEAGLWHLVACGLITSDGFSTARSMVDGTRKSVLRSARSRRRPRRRSPTSRWSLLQGPPRATSTDGLDEDCPDDATAAVESVVQDRAMQLLHRCGVMFPEVLAREPLAPRWRDLVRIYRRAEARGEIRGGRFVTGFVGEQFALPEAVEALRRFRKTPPDGKLLLISACDPLNLAGVLTPGPRVPALVGNLVVFRDGAPVASLQGGEMEWRRQVDETTRDDVVALLQRRRSGLKLVEGGVAAG